tara:strand:+ start:159 stop:428 length:270 start_codon:yes stop_codon:yes gene_type:complete
MKIIILNILISVTFICSGQNKKFENWTKNERSQYSKLSELVQYVSEKRKQEISKDTLFDKFIFFDYVLNDTNIERRQKDSLFLTHFSIV